MIWLQRFLIGRYGMDPLGLGLVGLYMLLALAATLSGQSWLLPVGYIPALFCLLRVLSRNTGARRRENDWFMSWWLPFARRTRTFWRRLRAKTARARDYTHIYFACPKCHAILRVPRGIGTIVVTCSECREQIRRKT